ncbi:hypothetical protein ECANGB1_388 [Enterospora canceri]|uniref:Uncharacterized protein n=1 Tax=Enterospora canceri TaxID=1081671 RepID=A0A1Y1S8T2_9MICR|nr:hypothetical protein ECANGB1_388 [Enterospora canceri]
MAVLREIFTKLAESDLLEVSDDSSDSSELKDPFNYPTYTRVVAESVKFSLTDFYSIITNGILLHSSNSQFILFEYYRSSNKGSRIELLNFMLNRVHYGIEDRSKSVTWEAGLFATFVARNRMIYADFGAEFINKLIKAFLRVVTDGGCINGSIIGYYLYMTIYYDGVYEETGIDEEVMAEAVTKGVVISDGIYAEYRKKNSGVIMSSGSTRMEYPFDRPNDERVFERIREMYREYGGD